MYAEYCYNSNLGAYSRGSEPDEANVTESGSYEDESSLVEDIVKRLGIYPDEWVDDEDGYGLSFTLEDLIDYCDAADAGAGDTILFWVEVDGKRYETSWDEADWGSDEDYVSNYEKVCDAFPEISEDSADLIAEWYDNEESEFDEGDLIDMIWASNYNSPAVKKLISELVEAGYYEQDDFPEEDEE